jgi:hypothetical protein
MGHSAYLSMGHSAYRVAGLDRVDGSGAVVFCA